MCSSDLPRFGTLADFDRLVAQASQRHIRVILDMVLNHTSDQHPWFLDAARSRTAAHHDFYVWSDGKPVTGGAPLPPNNWVSLFGGSAWQYTPAVRQFYYHMFYPQQPDLNWRNPAVEHAMTDALRFWLNRNVAGSFAGHLYGRPVHRQRAAAAPGASGYAASFANLRLH